MIWWPHIHTNVLGLPRALTETLELLLSPFVSLLLTRLPGPARVALTHEVSAKRFSTGGAGEEVDLIRIRGHSWTGGDHVTRAGASPGAAPVAVAKLEAAAVCVRPQRPDEGTQGRVYVVSEKDALMLEGGRRGGGYTQNTHTYT